MEEAHGLTSEVRGKVLLRVRTNLEACEELDG